MQDQGPIVKWPECSGFLKLKTKPKMDRVNKAEDESQEQRFENRGMLLKYCVVIAKGRVSR